MSSENIMNMPDFSLADLFGPSGLSTEMCEPCAAIDDASDPTSSPHHPALDHVLNLFACENELVSPLLSASASPPSPGSEFVSSPCLVPPSPHMPSVSSFDLLPASVPSASELDSAFMDIQLAIMDGMDFSADGPFLPMNSDATLPLTPPISVHEMSLPEVPLPPPTSFIHPQAAVMSKESAFQSSSSVDNMSMFAPGLVPTPSFLDTTSLFSAFGAVPTMSRSDSLLSTQSIVSDGSLFSVSASSPSTSRLCLDILPKEVRSCGKMPREKGRPGRKPKPRPTDPSEIQRELQEKRRKNTEAARRSRVKRTQRYDEMEVQLDELTKENEDLKQELALLRSKLKLYEQ